MSKFASILDKWDGWDTLAFETKDTRIEIERGDNGNMFEFVFKGKCYYYELELGEVVKKFSYDITSPLYKINKEGLIRILESLDNETGGLNGAR